MTCEYQYAFAQLGTHAWDDREITEEDVDACISTSAVGSPPVDILVRTSGVKRLRDFLTWQVCYF